MRTPKTKEQSNVQCGAKVRVTHAYPIKFLVALGLSAGICSEAGSKGAGEPLLRKRLTWRHVPDGIVELFINRGLLSREEAELSSRGCERKLRGRPCAEAARYRRGRARKGSIRRWFISAKSDRACGTRKEVVAQARARGWAQPDTLPAWCRRTDLGGVVRHAIRKRPSPREWPVHQFPGDQQRRAV